jgi:hypothetical protein
MARMEAPASGVTVRMYRQGLGDCFLLAFRGSDGEPRYMLIDCGILKNSPQERERMERVMEQIVDATGNRVHVLVATHEHWDHLCGFFHARELFDKLTVEEVWLAWTEDPGDAAAASLRTKHERSFQAVQAALTRMHLSSNERLNDTALKIDALNDFFGAVSDGVVPGAGERRRQGMAGEPFGFSKQTDGAMESVRVKSKARYHRPGQLPELKDVPNVRIYVLGPPAGDELFKSDPRQGEAYMNGFSLDLGISLFSAAQQGPVSAMRLSTEDEEWRELSLPFEMSHRISRQEAAADEWFQQHYFGSKGANEGGKLPSAAAMKWRRIDSDWLEAASQLALQLDSDTNNSSLVLAIELLPSGRVLLFPGDAQAGSWRSWEGVTFHVPEPGKPDRTVPALDLLKRTVFYKVGHHASHNATLRAKGLELMESGDLVAMIPVDMEVAHRPKGSNPNGWDMPFPPLLKRLREKTRGRVIRADEDLPAEDRPPQEPAGIQPDEWKAFRKQVTYADDTFGPDEKGRTRPLYVEYTVTP